MAALTPEVREAGAILDGITIALDRRHARSCRSPDGRLGGGLEYAVIRCRLARAERARQWKHQPTTNRAFGWRNGERTHVSDTDRYSFFKQMRVEYKGGVVCKDGKEKMLRLQGRHCGQPQHHGRQIYMGRLRLPTEELTFSAPLHRGQAFAPCHILRTARFNSLPGGNLVCVPFICLIQNVVCSCQQCGEGTALGTALFRAENHEDLSIEWEEFERVPSPQ